MIQQHCYCHRNQELQEGGGELGIGPRIDCGELWALQDFPMCYLSCYLCEIGVTRLLQLRMLPFHRVRTVPNAADGLS